MLTFSMQSQRIARYTNVAMLLIVVIAVGRGLFIPLMNNDSAHHANIALAMHETGDYVNLMDRDVDYMDKPHLLFWVSALSYKLFGVNPFAYRFPSLLFTLIGLFATYKLAERLYSVRVGQLSVVILSTAYAFFMANVDVRMDAILTAAIIFSIWQLITFADSRSWLSLLLSALGMALGFAAKGAIGIVMPGIAIFFYLAYRRSWREMLDIRWLLLGATVVLLLAPVIYCFYVQFDLHPEKVIRGTTGNSGIAFLLFGQSIQRYSGSGWGGNGDSDPFFFAHTFLWAFLPWSVLAIVALWISAKRHFTARPRLWSHRRLFIPTTIVAILIIISGSQFKLPHYLNVLFPLIAINLAAFMDGLKQRWERTFVVVQWVVVVCILVLTVILNVWSFAISDVSIGVVSVALFLLLIYFLIRDRMAYVTITLIATALCYFNLTFNFYPKLMRYQAGNVLADFCKSRGIPADDIRYLSGYGVSNSLDFHLASIIPAATLDEIQDSPGILICTDDAGLDAITGAGLRFNTVARASERRVSKIDLRLLNPRQRNTNIGPHFYLIRLNGI